MVALNAPAKVTYLNDVAIFDQYVLRFDISVNEALFVHKIDARTDLYEKVKSCIFTQVFFFSD